MTKGINRSARRSFHRVPWQTQHPRVPMRLQFARLPLLRRADIFFIFARGIGPSSDFHGSLRNTPVRCFFGISFAVRQTRLRCFSSRPCVLFYRLAFDKPSQTACRRRCRRGQSIAASSDKRVRPYRCRSAAFSRSITPAGCREV